MEENSPMEVDTIIIHVIGVENGNSMDLDHDLLIRVDENVKNLIIEIKDMKDGTTVKLTDHELRLRRLETWGAIAVGLGYALQFYFNFIHK